MTSNRLFDFSDSSARDECRTSLAQAVRVLRPGCLPCILPKRVTAAFPSQLALSLLSSSSGMLMVSLRVLCV